MTEEQATQTAGMMYISNITDIDSPWINETYYIVGISGGGGSTPHTAFSIFADILLRLTYKILYTN